MENTSRSTDEGELFEVLDRYVRSLSSDDDATSTLPLDLLDAYPELTEMLQCLDGLDELARHASAEARPRSPASTDDTAHQKFGRYELIRQIGRGGMGVVFEARQTALDARVALKVVRSGEFASEEEIARFYAEAQAAAGLRHPNIVCVHDVGECQGQHYLTMDLIGEGTLADLIRRKGRLEPRRAAELLATIARAVAYLHDKEIIHRDLKPSNILLDEADVPYVTDFGLAKVFQRDSGATATGTIIGTANYMSPEQAGGHSRQVSERSDVYSLGSILYEMLTGEPPFHGDKPLDVILQVLESEPEPPRRKVPGLPAELSEICLACLEKSPDDRLESAARLADELERFLRDESIRLEPRSRIDRVQRWIRREPALASRLGIVAAGTCIVQANFHLTEGISFTEHVRVMVVIGAWALACIVCQKLMNWDRLEGRMPYVWAVTDVIFLTTLLVIARPGEAIGPIVIGFPLLVVASGLWFETKLVGLMTGLSCLGYLVVNLVRGDADSEAPDHYPYIFAVVLCGIGYIVAYQVARIRTLSQYFERRR